MSLPTLTDEDLQKFASIWLEFAREPGGRDDAEVTAWKKELERWTDYPHYQETA